MTFGDAQSLFEAIQDSAVIIDRAGRILEWNQGASALFGYSAREVTGRSLNLVYQQNHPFPKIIQEMLSQQQKKWTADTPFVRKNGTTGICRTTASLTENPKQGGKPLALILQQNITEDRARETALEKTSEKISDELHECLELLGINCSLLSKSVATSAQLEKQLRESELRFHVVAENATDMIARHAPDGTFLYASPSCKTLLDYDSDELNGNSIYRLVHHEDAGRLRKVFSRRRDAPNHHILTFRIRRKDGEYRWFESNIRIIRDDATRIVHEFQAASRDVTSRIMDKKARLRGQQLAHVFRLSTMEEMASGMAHEISQPLAAVVNYTQGCVRYLQKKEGHDPAQLTEIMNKAVAQAERAGEVIHRLKNFFCKGQLVRTACKINSLIRETVTLIRSDLTTSRTRVEFDLGKEISQVSADRIQLQQVILNLIQNSIDAMKETSPRQRKIRIQTEDRHAEKIEITVTDSGPGFSKDMVHKVFKPFYTTKAHGRGMGLAICRSIIEAHGGEFIIHPNTQNNSWIRFTLPKHDKPGG